MITCNKWLQAMADIQQLEARIAKLEGRLVDAEAARVNDAKAANEVIQQLRLELVVLQAELGPMKRVHTIGASLVFTTLLAAILNLVLGKGG